jgi:hypothetical protein
VAATTKTVNSATQITATVPSTATTWSHQGNDPGWLGDHHDQLHGEPDASEEHHVQAEEER